MAQWFPIAPAGAGPLVLFVLIAAVLLGVAGGVGRSVLASRMARFEITDRALDLKGDWWGREIPHASLRGSEARVVDLREERDLQPVSRRFGTGLPGYASGWFRLRNGERALVYLTNQRRVVLVPTDLGYTVMLSPTDPEGLVRALRESSAPD
jgi:hypothetical protein